MARYIDVDEFAEAICNFPAIDEHSANAVISLLRGHPAADVAKVKHGEWIDRYKNKHANHLYECSICSGTALYEFYSNELRQTKGRQALTAVCPHCGAKMGRKPREGGAE